MIVLDLKSKEGLEAFMALVDRADIFVSNYTPRALKDLGIDGPVLTKRNPGLIYATANGFGPNGPIAGKN